MAIRPPEDAPHAPVMPSFASLRDPRRRTAVDVLMTPAPEERAAVDPPTPPAPRPPEWSDLLLLGAHVARWSLRCVARWFARGDVSEGSATLRG
jgi:hypothetical protein